MAVLVLAAASPARAQGLPTTATAAPIGGLITVAGPPVAVDRLVLAIGVDAVPAPIPLLPRRVSATVEARYVLRLTRGSGDDIQPVSLRFLGNQRVSAHFDGRPANVYPAVYDAAGTAETGPPPDPMWVDPLTGERYRPSLAAAISAPQAWGVDVAMRPGATHELRLRQERVALGWDAGRYLNTVNHLAVPLQPQTWQAFGPVELHLRLPPGYVAGVAGDENGTGRLRSDAYQRWSAPPAEVRLAAMATDGMWFGLVTQRRHVLWFLAATWILFVFLRALVWRFARRRDAWGWAALPALAILPVAVAWVSWESLRVPMWGYPFSLFQYALIAGLGLYLAGRLLGDVTGLLWLRWRYWREARPRHAARGGAVEAAQLARPAPAARH
ncbi:MAG TPA: hypothetical protein VIK92_04945 [Thermaerobacter sp.]